jgi:hypothetical protein
MAMLIAACGSSGGKSAASGPATTAGLSGATGSAGKPTPGGKVTFALPAESTGG